MSEQTMTPPKAKREFRFTGLHMLACMAAFFGVIIAVNITMATFATSSWTGLVVKNSYVASQKFNAELAEAEAQAALGWTSQLSYQGQQLTFDLRDDAGKVLSPSVVMLSLGRPAFEQKDQQIELTANAAGGYETAITLDNGTWMMRVDAVIGDQTYRRDLRLFVSNGKGIIE